jgi:FHS family glucose/mannose:H+ symporter-like MFS transporter
LKSKTSDKNIGTVISYIIFSYTAVAVVSLGAMKLELAKYLGIETSELQNVFTLFTIAVTLSMMISKLFLQNFSIRFNLVLSGFLMILGTVGITTVQNIILFSVYIALIGVGVGFYLSFANFIIVNLYDEDRSSKLMILNASYSVCAVLTPAIAAFFIGKGFSWVVIYRIFLIMVFISLALTFKSDFSDILPKQEEKNRENKKISEKFDRKIYLCSAALFLYSFFEATMNYWIVEYFVASGVSSNFSKLGLSVFWGFVLFGRVAVAFIIKYVKLENYIKVSSVLAGLSLLGLLLVHKVFLMFFFVGLSGMFSSALYPSIVSYSTQGMKKINPAVMTFVIFSGMLGMIFCSYISGFLNKIFDVQGPISTAFILIIGVFFLIAATESRKIKPPKQTLSLAGFKKRI